MCHLSAPPCLSGPRLPVAEGSEVSAYRATGAWFESCQRDKFCYFKLELNLAWQHLGADIPSNWFKKLSKFSLRNHRSSTSEIFCGATKNETRHAFVQDFLLKFTGCECDIRGRGRSEKKGARKNWRQRFILGSSPWDSYGRRLRGVPSLYHLSCLRWPYIGQFILKDLLNR